MPTPPLRSAVSGTPTRATANTGFGALYDYVTDLLGATGNSPAARTALGVAPRASRIDVASVAGTVNLTTAAPDTDDIRMTGALAITAFTVTVGRVIRVTANAAFTLANNASIVTQTGALLTMAAGDSFMLRATAANVVEVLGLVRASAFPINMAVAAQQLDMTASITSNAITVTLNPITLSFHNTVQTTGTPVVIAMPTALTLVIAATDSFGAVTADGVRRLAILAHNNAGTIELSASSIAGGVNLDEVGVLTTAATATTLTAIKAAAVRTGVAYKVVGFVDATFTTAVGWGSLAVVQPIGGQALAAMSSLGYGQRWTDVTGSRASAVTYYNTTGRAIKAAVTGGAGTLISGIAVTVNGLIIYTNITADPGNGSTLGGEFTIPVGASYLVTTTGSMSSWFELR